MKKILKIVAISLILPLIYTSTANAETIYHYGDGTSGTTPPNSTQSAVGGFAIVNPETGIVHGVITGSTQNFGGNDKTMNTEYMGCPVGCLIVQQSTSDINKNVSGIKNETDGSRTVIYDLNKNIFQVQVPNVTETQTINESVSNNSVVETNINVNRSTRIYEFGVQDFTNTNGQFQMTEVAPLQNTSAQITATTKEFVCEESGVVCSQRLSNASTTLGEEVISFSERKTSEQVLAQAVAEARTKIREQVSLILSMLGRWTLN